MAFRKRLYLSAAERYGLLLAAAILSVFIAGCYYLSLQAPDAGTDIAVPAEEQAIDSLCGMLTSTTEEGYVRTAGRYTQTAGRFPFDPNTADSLTFVRLGLTPRQARSALRYRRAGGRWRSAEDFSHLYGLSPALFDRLRPYIRIIPETGKAHPARRFFRNDSLHHAHRTPKLAEGTVIDLNTADTTQLKGIPGIGSYYAAKICRYREALGGFVRPEQIGEVDGLPDGIERWFSTAPAPAVRTTDINRSTFKQLVRHPYLSYEQVKAIFEYRRKYGKLKSWEQLRQLGVFTEADILRLTPYIIF